VPTASTHCSSFYPTPGVFPSWACPRYTNLTPSTVAVAAGAPATPTGVCVFFHPSQALDVPLPYTVPAQVPQGIAVQNFATAAAASGWVTLYPPYPSDRSNGPTQSGANEATMHADCVGASDTGQTFVDESMVAWDHMALYSNVQYPGLPLVVCGFSLGSWMALEIAKNRTSSIIGYAGIAVPTIWETVNTTPSFGDLSPTPLQMDMSGTFLSGVTLPGWIGWQTGDTVVGYSTTSSPPSNIQLIAASAGGTITTYSDNGNHVFFTPQAASMASWIATV
jgi:hypothetical protein